MLAPPSTTDLEAIGDPLTRQRNFFLVKVNGHVQDYDGSVCENAAHVQCGMPLGFRTRHCEVKNDKCWDMYLFANPNHERSPWRKKSFTRLLNYIGSESLEPASPGDFILFWTYSEHTEFDYRYGSNPILVGIYVIDNVDKILRPSPTNDMRFGDSDGSFGEIQEYTFFPRAGLSLYINPELPAEGVVQRRAHPWAATLSRSDMESALDYIHDELGKRVRLALQDSMARQEQQDPVLNRYRSQLDALNSIIDEFQRPSTQTRMPAIIERAAIPITQDSLARAGATPSIGDEAQAGAEKPLPPQVEKLAQTARREGLYYPNDLLVRFHISMQKSPLVILSGHSGTGKTQLGRIYAKSEGAQYYPVKVQPDWVSPSYLWGVYDYMRRSFVPTRFARMVRQAWMEWEASQRTGRPPKRFVLCLDEMNLAHVEYYLANVLSAMEEPLVERWVDLYDSDDGEDAEEDFPTRLRLTPNLSLIGTLNIDETTHSLSPKVIDRAHVVRLDRVDLDELHILLAATIDKELVDFVFRYLKSIHLILADDSNQQFGYRVARQMVEWVDTATRWPYGWPRERALDAEICQKILPRLQVDPDSDVQMRMFDNLLDYFEETEGFNESATWLRDRKRRLEAGEAISGQQ